MPKPAEKDPVVKMVRMYETRISNASKKIERMRAECQEEVNRVESQIAKYKIMRDALKNGTLKA